MGISLGGASVRFDGLLLIVELVMVARVLR